MFGADLNLAIAKLSIWLLRNAYDAGTLAATQPGITLSDPVTSTALGCWLSATASIMALSVAEPLLASSLICALLLVAPLSGQPLRAHRHRWCPGSDPGGCRVPAAAGRGHLPSPGPKLTSLAARELTDHQPDRRGAERRSPFRQGTVR
jgi:hypothetical protein